MSKDKQIEEMAKAICRVRGSCNDVCNPIEDCRAFKYAERAYEAGYRKASEVAGEIFEELEKSGLWASRYPIIAELKKKYTEEGK